jgi:hypothetical protein
MSGANDWERFRIGSDSYLAGANMFNDYSFGLDSIVLRATKRGVFNERTHPLHPQR